MRCAYPACFLWPGVRKSDALGGLEGQVTWHFGASVEGTVSIATKERPETLTLNAPRRLDKAPRAASGKRIGRFDLTAERRMRCAYPAYLFSRVGVSDIPLTWVSKVGFLGHTVPGAFRWLRCGVESHTLTDRTR